MRKSLGLALVAVALTVTGALAADDFEIQSSSNAPAHPVGQKLTRGAMLTLPENAVISFFDRTAAGGPITRQCAGKYDGPIDNCRSARASGRSSTVPGATRGAVR